MVSQALGLRLYKVFHLRQIKQEPLLSNRNRLNDLISELTRKGWATYAGGNAWCQDHAIIRSMLEWLYLDEPLYRSTDKTLIVDVYYHPPGDMITEGLAVGNRFAYAIPAWADVLSFYALIDASYPNALDKKPMPPRFIHIVKEEVGRAKDDKEYRMARLAEIVLTKGTSWDSAGNNSMHNMAVNYLRNGGETV